MARFNEILVGRFNRALQKTTGIKGAASTPVLASEIVPSWALFWGAENRYLESWFRYGQFFLSGGAVAAQNQGLRLRNPSTSNVICVFEKLAFSEFSVADTNVSVQVQPRSTDLTTIFNLGANARFDPRGQPTSILIFSNQTNAPAGTGTKFACAVGVNAPPIDAIVTDIQEFPLLPGDAIDVFTSAVNLTMGCTFFWRERFLEESERT